MAFKSRKTIEEQKQAISKIMQDDPNIEYYRFRFGKYKGCTFEYVLKTNKNYLEWLYDNVDDMDEKLLDLINTHVKA